MAWRLVRALLRQKDRRRPRKHPARCLAVEPLEGRALLATLPARFTEVAIAAGLSNATAMEIAPGGDLWVLEQTGAVKRFRPGSTTADVVGRVGSLGLNSTGERGLLGIAFDPQYASNKQVYLYFTTTDGGLHNRISRFTVNDATATDYFFAGASEQGPDRGSSGTPTQAVIFDLDPLSASNHNGGAIHFGPDGKLYVAVGDNAVGSNSQSLATVHGKILRMNPSGSAPSDNPFVGSTTGKNQTIWALGLRNPYTFAFQPGTGRMFINDVGQNTWEEINDGLAGANYGWPSAEGNAGTSPSGPGVYHAPLYAYSHGSGTFQGFAITGGAFYNPSIQQFPASYTGDYFFADFVNNWINLRDSASGAVTRFASGASGPVDLRVASDGSLYYLARNLGQVMRINFPNGQPPLAGNDAYETPEDTTLNVSVPGVLSNDSDIDSASLSAVLVDGPGRGTLDLKANGSFTYIPDNNYAGSDSFTYQASDGQQLSSVATVTLTVRPENDAPTLAPIVDQLVAEGGTLFVPLALGDVDTALGNLTVTAQGDQQTLLPPGSLEIQGTGANRTLKVSPAPGQRGDALVRVTVNDGAASVSRQFFLTVSTAPVPWHNPLSAFDVNDDGSVAPNDALTIINWINSNGSGLLPVTTDGGPPPPYLDVAPDHFVAPNDVLYVINFLNASSPGGTAEGEFPAAARESKDMPDEALWTLLAADVLSTGVSRRQRFS